jgi:hypothetical protein
MSDLLPIYRLALAENLTAKQAGAKYNCRHDSLAKCKTRYGLPTLRNEWDAGVEEQMDKMNDQQLLSYSKALGLPKNSRSIREHRICNLILERRKLK